MRAVVDKELCSGCGPCEEICPAVFEIVDDLARVKVDPVPPEEEERCREAMEDCPLDAISIEE